MWLWIGRLLAFLGTSKKVFLWLGLALPFVTQIIGWVGRIWGAARNTLLGRLLRMAGLLSVAGTLSLGAAHAIFFLVSEIVQSTSIGEFSWPTEPVIHAIIGAVDLVMPLAFLLDLLVYWVYLSLFLLAIRMGKYILSLTAG